MHVTSPMLRTLAALCLVTLLALWLVTAGGSVHWAHGQSDPIAGTERRTLQTCATLEAISSADDDFTFWAAPAAVTLGSVGCRYDGTASTVATFALEDSGGTAVTHTAPTCVTGATVMTYQTITAAGALVAGEGLAFDVTNSPDGDDKYTLCVRYTDS